MKLLKIILVLLGLFQIFQIQAQSRNDIIRLYEEKNYAEIIRLLNNSKLLEDKWYVCMLSLSYLYTNDTENAKIYFKKCANGTDKCAIISKIELGRIACKERGGWMWHPAEAYYADKGIDTNHPKEIEAVEYWEDAVKLGDKYQAPYLLALHKYEPLKNYARAMSLFRLAAINGHVGAQVKMGDYFQEGKFVSVDFNEAIKWYTLASDANYGLGDLNLGLCNEQLFRKSGEERYLKKALKYFYKADAKGFCRSVITKQEDDGYTTFSNEDPSKQLYEEGVLDANKYNSFEEWKKNVVAKLAVESDVDINIPHNAKEPNKLALIIANENYKYEHFVPYAENDGEVLSKYFEYTLGIPNDNIHLLKDVGLNEMKRGVEWLIENSGNKTFENVFVYYVGHGVPANDLSTSYLLPVDGYAEDPSTGLDIQWLYKKLGQINAKTYLFLDACFSGAGRHQEMLVEARGVAIKPKDMTPINNTIVMSACQGIEMAYSYEEQKHGLFTYFFLKKLQETNGDVTLDELGNYITIQVKEHSKRENGKSQTPTVVPAVELGEAWKAWKLK